MSKKMIILIAFVGIIAQSVPQSTSWQLTPSIHTWGSISGGLGHGWTGYWSKLTLCRFRWTCHRDQDDDQTGVDDQPPRIQIPKGYEGSPELGYHKLYTDTMTWNDARKMCQADGAYLSIPNSDEEAQLMMDMINGTNSGDGTPGHRAWVGLHDLFAEGEWNTIFGDPISSTGYQTWSPRFGGVPDNTRGNQNCADMHTSGGLDDVRCNLLLWYICEYTPMGC